MADVFRVAEFFIQLANQQEDDQMTNLKLNKLLYYAQGAFLARTGKPLFQDQIGAWTLGPVVPDVYHKYKVCGKNPIPWTENDIDLSIFQEEEIDTLFDVMREFGRYTGSALVSMTHKAGSPWAAARAAGQDFLPPEEIRAYFLSHPVPRLEDQISAEKVLQLPAEWYDPAEDAEWEAYL